MKNYLRQAAWMCVILAGVWNSRLAAQTTAPAEVSPDMAEATAATKPAAEVTTGNEGTAESNTGHIRGNDVYIRSGFHQNYYPVTKLNRGDRVTIVGSEFGWLEILPPAGTYSVVDKSFVDRPSPDSDAGVLNDRAWAFAGSNLNDRRYAKQVELARGARVKIIGETADGAFVKIEPPAGATLWIKGDLVDRTGRLAAADESPKPKIQPIKPGELDTAVAPPPKKTTPGDSVVTSTIKRPDPVSAQASSPYTTDLTAIEAQIAAEQTKPSNQRDFKPIIAKLRPLADQGDDQTTQLYAQARIKQLEDHMELIAAVHQLREIKETSFQISRKIEEERERIRAQAATPMDDIVVRGEIRVSGLYDGSGARPKRWRLVDPKKETIIAYIDVPKGSPIDPVQYYGKYVGIRASERHLLRDTNPPIPIYTVEEILVQDPQALTPSRALDTSWQQASPQAPLVDTPATAPATSEGEAVDPAVDEIIPPES